MMTMVKMCHLALRGKQGAPTTRVTSPWFKFQFDESCQTYTTGARWQQQLRRIRRPSLSNIVQYRHPDSRSNTSLKCTELPTIFRAVSFERCTSLIAAQKAH